MMQCTRGTQKNDAVGRIIGGSCHAVNERQLSRRVACKNLHANHSQPNLSDAEMTSLANKPSQQQQTAGFHLRPHPRIPRSDKPFLLIVLDGWGESSQHNDQFNAIHVARTPHMDALRHSAPGRWRLLKAHGTAVGLPSDADMGNSEVGHNALGAGQVVDQGAKCVDAALTSGQLWELDGWRYVEPAARKGTLHFIGLLSDGGVHSRYDLRDTR